MGESALCLVNAEARSPLQNPGRETVPTQPDPSKPSTTPSGEAASFTSREGLTALGVAPVSSLVWKPTEVAHESATMRTVKFSY